MYKRNDECNPDRLVGRGSYRLHLISFRQNCHSKHSNDLDEIKKKSQQFTNKSDM